MTSAPTLASRSLRPLSEIPRLHLDAVDVQISHVDVPRFRRQAARIHAETAVMEFVAASVRQRETGVPIADTGELGGLF
jgi:hypothetical protein